MYNILSIPILHISVSLDNILTPVICVMSGFLQQKLGPLRVLQLSCLPYTLAWVLAALATQHSTLYVSRSALKHENKLAGLTTHICTLQFKWVAPDLHQNELQCF